MTLGPVILRDISNIVDSFHNNKRFNPDLILRLQEIRPAMMIGTLIARFSLEDWEKKEPGSRLRMHSLNSDQSKTFGWQKLRQVLLTLKWRFVSFIFP